MVCFNTTGTYPCHPDAPWPPSLLIWDRAAFATLPRCKLAVSEPFFYQQSSHLDYPLLGFSPRYSSSSFRFFLYTAVLCAAPAAYRSPCFYFSYPVEDLTHSTLGILGSENPIAPLTPLHQGNTAQFEMINTTYPP